MNPPLPMHSLQRQRGATLVVALIFLVLLTLFAISAFNSSSTNLRVVGNTQARQESVAAAQLAIENTISSTLFTTNPEGVEANPVNVDIDQNGSFDYAVRMTPKPSCYRVKPIKNAELNPALENDRACMQSGVVNQAGLEIEGANLLTDNSLCANTEWNLRAEVIDTRTSAKVAVNQGVGVRVITADADTYCK